MVETVPAGSAAAVDRAAAALGAGGVVLAPTDTVYGLAVAPDDGRAVDRLFAIKRRPVVRTLPVMVARRGQLSGLGVVVTAAAERLIASAFVPGPLTIALGFSGGGRPEWLDGRGEMAFRIPDDPFMLALLARIGPLFVTSANIHGQRTRQTVDEIVPRLAFAPDLAVDGGARETVPSTLVNCAVDPPLVEREGAAPRAAVEALLA